MDNKYNGWTNYATWRVNLEIFSNVNYEKEDFVSSDEDLDPSSLADMLEEMADNVITNHGDITNGPALDYARAFLSEVNFYEIAEHIIDDINNQ